MKIGLIDVDSKIPNLALMKISSHMKSCGHEVSRTFPIFADAYDQIYASKIFNYSELPILPANAIVGGPGFDLKKQLPFDDTEVMPDYKLFRCRYAMGFTSRGCNRKCPWCVVPQMEGKWHPVADIYDFWAGQEKLMLLDNSLNTDTGHFEKILHQLIKEKIHVDFSQGLDIRHLNDRQAHLLHKVGRSKRIHFAWDLMRTERAVRKGIKILDKYKLTAQSIFYVLIGFNTTEEEDLYRVRTLWGLGAWSFVMPYKKSDNYQRKFARWVNHKAIFKSIRWEDYVEKSYPRRSR